MGFILRFFNRSQPSSRLIARQRLESMLARERTRTLPDRFASRADDFPAVLPSAVTEKGLSPLRGFFR